MERTKRGWIASVTLSAIGIAFSLFIFSGVALAQPNLVTLSDLIEINVNPASIPADNTSTSKITISVSLPEMLGGGVAANTKINVSTTLGTLKDAENESNSGSEIELITNDTAIAVALLSGEEEGVADIAVRAPAIEDAVNSILGNQTTVYIVKNSTVITLLEAGATPTATATATLPPTPPAGTPPYLNLVANPADILADGSSISTITASVWNGEEWVLENLTVNFSTSLGNITKSAVIMNGTATAILTAGLEEGVATITGEANLGGDIDTVTNTTTVNFMAPGATPTPPVLTSTPTSLTPAVTVSPTPVATVSPAPAPTPSPARKPWIPGFEVAFAIAGLLTVAYLVLRKGRKE